MILINKFPEITNDIIIDICNYANYELFIEFVKKIGINYIDSKSKQTLLHHVCYFGNNKKIMYLVKNGIDYHLKDANGKKAGEDCVNSTKNILELAIEFTETINTLKEENNAYANKFNQLKLAVENLNK